MKTEDNTLNYRSGIDLLRAISALFVILIHLLPSIKTIELSSAWCAQKIMVSLFDTCINLFALISGYLCWNKQFRWKRIINMHITVLFYSILCTMVATLFVEVSISDFVYSFIPLLSVRFWYFSAYIAMCFLIPFMNKGIACLSKSEGIRTIIGLLFAFTILTFLKDGNHTGIGIHYGFSTLWLSVLYICGGLIAKFQLNDILTKIRLVGIGLTCWIVTAGWVMICSSLFNEQTEERWVPLLYKYSSPTVSIMSICIFMIFCDVQIKNRVAAKIISFLATTSFGVYILGTHWSVMRYIIEAEIFGIFRDVNGLLFALVYTLIGLGLYLFFAVIEYIRQVFFKFLHCEKICIFVENKLERIISLIH